MNSFTPGPYQNSDRCPQGVRLRHAQADRGRAGPRESHQRIAGMVGPHHSRVTPYASRMASGETNFMLSTSDVAAMRRSNGSLWWNGKVVSGSMCRGSKGSNWMRFAANWAGNNSPYGAERVSFPMRTFKAISSKLMGDNQRTLARSWMAVFAFALSWGSSDKNQSRGRYRATGSFRVLFQFLEGLIEIVGDLDQTLGVPAYG